ncbi:TetR/AcrR family transcriptional regulator [Shewanella maritima]|uniref:TetR/AcrR family transcriptional regulator n=1 Tax=Shewanella maritima TaxID=2520507 RepID=UPI003734C9AC
MRNAEFDRESVLRGAMCAFTTNGYAKTSMQDLTKATGLHPGSIYCAFENKKGLLLAAIEQYQLDKTQQFDTFFNNTCDVQANLQTYLNHIVDECVSGDAARACLLGKSLSEVGEQDAQIRHVVEQHFQGWESALMQVIEQGKQTGQITNTQPSELLAQYLIMGIFGLRTYAHTHPQKQMLMPLANKLLQDII